MSEPLPPSPLVATRAGETAWPSVTLLSTRLSPPRLPSFLVERTWLLTELEAVYTSSLTLVSASAGSGKTTLLSAWASRQEHPVAWLSLDALDADPVRFWASCIAALRRYHPTLRLPRWNWTNCGHSSSRKPTRAGFGLRSAAPHVKWWPMPLEIEAKQHVDVCGKLFLLHIARASATVIFGRPTKP